MKKLATAVLAVVMVMVFSSVAAAVTQGNEWGMAATGSQVPEAGGSNRDINLYGGYAALASAVEWNGDNSYGVAANTANSNPGTAEVAIGARITSDPITGRLDVKSYSGNVIQKGLWSDAGQLKAQLVRKNDGTFNCRFKGTLDNRILQAGPNADNVDDGATHFVVCYRYGTGSSTMLGVNVDNEVVEVPLNIGSISNNKNVHVGNKNGQGDYLDQHFGKNFCSAYAYGSGAITYVTNLVSGGC